MTIDYIMHFPDEATAQADPVVGKYYYPPDDRGPGGWMGHNTIPNVQLWQPADDTYETVTRPDGGESTIVHHKFFPGFFLLIALMQQDPALDAHTAMQIVADREASAADLDWVIASVYTQAELDTMALQPTFAGSIYPFHKVAPAPVRA